MANCFPVHQLPIIFTLYDQNTCQGWLCLQSDSLRQPEEVISQVNQILPFEMTNQDEILQSLRTGWQSEYRMEIRKIDPLLHGPEKTSENEAAGKDWFEEDPDAHPEKKAARGTNHPDSGERIQIGLSLQNVIQKISRVGEEFERNLQKIQTLSEENRKFNDRICDLTEAYQTLQERNEDLLLFNQELQRRLLALEGQTNLQVEEMESVQQLD